jgi:RimJ/RimL family protein N-acetyltransferase
MSTPVDAVQYCPKKVMLHDGSPIVIRAVCRQDALRLFAMFSRLSQQSIYQRYMGMRKFTYRDIQALCNIDQQREMRLIAVGKKGAIIGETSYVKLDGPESDIAEFAILIEDAYQGRGVGKVLFHELIAHARTTGIRDFLILTSSQNAGMINLVKRSGYPYTSHTDGNTREFYLSLTTANHELKRAS